MTHSRPPHPARLAKRACALLALAACQPAPVGPAPEFSIAAPATAIATPAPPPPLATPSRPLSAAQRACLDALDGSEVAACRDGDAQSCHRIARGSRDASCRDKLEQRACDADLGAACSDLAFDLLGATAGVLARQAAHSSGDVAPNLRDPSTAERAAKLARRGCELAAPRACLLLGEMLAAERADSDPPETAHQALAAFERGCILGNGACCRIAGDRLGDDERDKKLRRYQHACERNDALGCVRLAEQISAAGSPQDLAKGAEMLRRACSQDEDDSDEGESCARLVDSSGPSADERGKLLARACRKGSARACFSLGQETYGAGQYAEAIDPLARVIALDPQNQWALRWRATALYFLGRFGDAVAAFEPACAAPDWRSYCELLLYTARGRSGDRDAAQKLRAAAKQLDLRAWPGPVVSFYLGDIGEPELLRQSKNPEQSAFRRQREGRWEAEQQCEAQFYLGQKAVIDGHARRAARHFEGAVEAKVPNFIETIAAKAELQRMRR